jgi:hypothetical protein
VLALPAQLPRASPKLEKAMLDKTRFLAAKIGRSTAQKAIDALMRAGLITRSGWASATTRFDFGHRAMLWRCVGSTKKSGETGENRRPVSGALTTPLTGTRAVS